MPLAAHKKTPCLQELDIINILRATHGELLRTGLAVSFDRVWTDSRTVKKGDLFVCLKGDRFDGHDFIDNAVILGATGILVQEDRWSQEGKNKIPAPVAIVKVNDTLTALGEMAAFWRRANAFQVVAVTGSSGKTTTKDMIASILQKNYAVTKTLGNFNNLIGLPLSLLSARPEDEVVVLEMGMNRFGEIRRLSEIARPDIGVITNVEAAHLEGVKTIDGVAKAKGELYESLGPDDMAIVNADDPHIAGLAKKCVARQISFGLKAEADVTATDISFGPTGKISFKLAAAGDSIQIHLQLPGRHNVLNALAASAIAVANDVDFEAIKEGLEDFRGTANRMEVLNLDRGLTIINDTYNANPGSMKAALLTLTEMKGVRPGIAVLGDMLELGEQASECHAALGRYAAELKVDYLLTMGDFASVTAQGAIQAGMPEGCVYMASNHKEIVSKLREVADSNAVILVKGSRRTRMEEVVRQLGGNI